MTTYLNLLPKKHVALFIIHKTLLLFDYCKYKINLKSNNFILGQSKNGSNHNTV